MRLDAKDMDWDEITRDMSNEDLSYIRGKIEQRLRKRSGKNILIEKAEG